MSDARLRQIHDAIGREPASALRVRGYKYEHGGWYRGGFGWNQTPQYVFSFALLKRYIRAIAAGLPDVPITHRQVVNLSALTPLFLRPRYGFSRFLGVVTDAIAEREGLHPTSKRAFEDQVRFWAERQGDHQVRWLCAAGCALMGSSNNRHDLLLVADSERMPRAIRPSVGALVQQYVETFTVAETR